MLSETEAMLGGETYIMGGDHIPAKVGRPEALSVNKKLTRSCPQVEGPALGHGVILQGGEVQHLATRGLGVKERISTITSYCANVPGLYDASYTSNIRPYSDIKVLYKQWAAYRLEKMKQEIEALQHQIHYSPLPLDVSKIHKFAEDQAHYLKRTARQLVSYEEHEKMLDEYGKSNLYKGPSLWKRAEQLPNFAERVASIHEGNWMTNSPFWHDLAESQVDIRMGKTLQAQTGRYKWEKSREFCMGDELLRQGLPEVFFSWLAATGLYALVCNIV